MKAKFVVIVLVLTLALAAAAPVHGQEPPPGLSITIERSALIGQFGVVHVTDHFTIHTGNGSAPVSSLDFGFSRMYRSNVNFVGAKDQQGSTLTIDGDVRQSSDVYWMRVNFGELGANKTYDFNVAMVLSGVIARVPAGFTYNFSAAPILTQDAEYANTTLLATQGSTFAVPENSSYVPTTLNGVPALIREFKPWKAYSNDTFFAGFRTVNQYLMDLKSAQRDIIISNTAGLSVKDTYSIRNIGIAITSLTITLPTGATNVMAYDVVGAMWATPQNPSPPYQISIQPRYPSGIRGNENFTFTLTYDVPSSTYLKQLKWYGAYNLTFGLVNNKEDYVFDYVTVRIITPNGVSVGDVKTIPESPVSHPIQYDAANRVFTLQKVTNLDNVTVGVALNYLPFWSGVGALPWLLGFEVAIAAVALAVKVRRGPELAVPVPVEKLREFVGLYDEKLVLSRELIVMEEDVARGGLVKHEFRRRRKVMEQRLDEINKSLMEVKAEVRAVSPRYDELIRRIDRAEAEVEVSRNSMNQVRSQYRAGKSTRETYDAMVNDLTRRTDRAEETVETILITLREDAR